MNQLKVFIFGLRAQGEKIPEPKLPPERPYNAQDCVKWCQEIKFGSRYGHRGSFYQRS